MKASTLLRIGDSIRILRKNKGWTQKKLASESGIHEVQIRRYENNQSLPRDEQLQKLASALGVEKDFFTRMDNIQKTVQAAKAMDEKAKKSFSAQEIFILGKDKLSQPITTSTQSHLSYKETEIKLHNNDSIYNHEYLDDMKFNGIMQKTNRGEELTPQESIFKSAYLERALRSIGDSFAQYYAMLNEEGQKKADEEITRTIKQLELLTKIPEYRKKD